MEHAHSKHKQGDMIERKIGNECAKAVKICCLIVEGFLGRRYNKMSSSSFRKSDP